MNPPTTLSQNFNTKSSAIFSNTNFLDAEFYFEKQHNFPIDLYERNIDDDEPDFDCEFLQGISPEVYKNEIDLDDEDQIDHFNDGQWDADIYDPYLESANY